METGLSQLFVTDFMTREVATINPSEYVGVATLQMEKHAIRSLVVGTLQVWHGIFTSTNARLANWGLNNEIVRDYMTERASVTCVSPRNSLQHCQDILVRGNYHHLPVTESGTNLDEVIGILSSTDINRAIEQLKLQAFRSQKA